MCCFSVVLYDHRAQGFSDRHDSLGQGDHQQVTYVDTFQDYVDDLAFIIQHKALELSSTGKVGIHSQLPP